MGKLLSARILKQYHLSLFIRGPDGFNSRNKRIEKISWHCPFKQLYGAGRVRIAGHTKQMLQLLRQSTVLKPKKLILSYYCTETPIRLQWANNFRIWTWIRRRIVACRDAKNCRMPAHWHLCYTVVLHLAMYYPACLSHMYKNMCVCACISHMYISHVCVCVGVCVGVGVGVCVCVCVYSYVWESWYSDKIVLVVNEEWSIIPAWIQFVLEKVYTVIITRTRTRDYNSLRFSQPWSRYK